MSWYDGDEAPAPAPTTGRRARRVDRAPARLGLRWRAGPRAVAGALVALALVGGAVALRTAAATPTGTTVDLPEPRAGASASSGSVAAAGRAGAEGSTGADRTAGALDGASDRAAADPVEAAPGVVVHVVGQVGSPGVVTLPVGSRVADAVTAAGGALPGADLSALNLAAVLADGAQVHVPLPGVVVAAPAGVGGDGAVAGSAGTADGVGGTVDLNSATEADLDALPGIGPVLAERIVRWRTDHGRFDSVDDLQQVSGIGPAAMERLRDLVRV
jgi:competence protein ComEA